MSKLMYAGLGRLIRNKLFIICCAAMFLVGAIIPFIVSRDTPIEKIFFTFSIIVGIIFSAFAGLFIGIEYGEGTIRNKLIVGHKRISIYFSNFLICSIAGLCMQLCYTIGLCITGMPYLGLPELSFGSISYLYFISVLITITFASIYTLFGMLISRRSGGVVISIFIAIFLIALAVVNNSRLKEPEYFGSFVYTDESGQTTEIEQELNPNYLRGIKKDIYQFVYDFQPMGQALQLSTMEIQNVNRLPLYSIVIIFITTGTGLFIFRKKDIK